MKVFSGIELNFSIQSIFKIRTQSPIVSGMGIIITIIVTIILSISA